MPTKLLAVQRPGVCRPCGFELRARVAKLFGDTDASRDGMERVHRERMRFVNSEWGWFAKPFSLSGVWVTWAEKLTALVMDWNAIPNTEIDRLARVVGSKLPSAA